MRTCEGPERFALRPDRPKRLRYIEPDVRGTLRLACCRTLDERRCGIGTFRERTPAAKNLCQRFSFAEREAQRIIPRAFAHRRKREIAEPRKSGQRFGARTQSHAETLEFREGAREERGTDRTARG